MDRRRALIGENQGRKILKRGLVTGSNVSYILYDDYELVFSGSGSFDSSLLDWDRLTDSPTVLKITVNEGITGIADYWGYHLAGEKMINATEIHIPNSVTFFGFMAFRDMKKLHTFYYKGTETEWNAIIGVENVAAYNSPYTVIYE